MKHLGDISKINGAEIEPVDIITFGSPCQDLSVAGKRAGLEGARSGLFMEAVRIIKEMREATDGKYPRFALWENVPGAFSSNKGEDFRIVLEELIKIVEEEAVMPQVPETGWAYADTYSGDGWSLAYRTFDAQHWGVPQRRRRIYLVADFTGESAGKVLFEREGLRGYFAAGRTPGERTTSDVEGGFGADDREGTAGKSASESGIAATLYAAYGTKWNGNAGAYNGENFILEPENKQIAFAQNQRDELRDLGDKAGALQAQTGMKQQTFIAAYESHPMDSRVKELEDDISPTVAAKWHKGAADTPLVCTKEQHLFENHSQDTRYRGPLDVSPIVSATFGMGGNNQPFVVETPVQKAYGISSYASNAMLSDNPHSGIYEAKTSRTLDVGGGNPACHQGGIVVCAEMPQTYGLTTKGNGDAFLSRERHTALSTGGGQAGQGYPCICMATQQGGAEILEETCPTITAAAGMSGNNQPVLCMADEPTFILDNIGGQAEYGVESHVNGTLRAGAQGAVAYATDVGFFNSLENQSPTLLARSFKDPHLVTYSAVTEIKKFIKDNNSDAPHQQDLLQFVDGAARTLACGTHAAGSHLTKTVIPDGQSYIVRRLTPTECARLQGFPDKWGHPEQKSDFSNDEYMFWRDVRNTHAEINGKNVKEYTKDQILKWYNKLHSDSAEYKMWGNGIALPPSLYCMQGMAEALTHEYTRRYCK